MIHHPMTPDYETLAQIVPQVYRKDVVADETRGVDAKEHRTMTWPPDDAMREAWTIVTAFRTHLVGCEHYVNEEGWRRLANQIALAISTVRGGGAE